MWIYTEHGFYSIVQDGNDPDYLLVRARVKGDLEALWPKATITVTPNNDYQYRAKVPRIIISQMIARNVLRINYTNFKDNIADKRRSPYYGRVWGEMMEMQEDLKLDTNKD